MSDNERYDLMIDEIYKLKTENKHLTIDVNNYETRLIGADSLVKTLLSENARLKAERDKAVAALKPKIIDILNYYLNDVLVCTRVWEAWSCGTMSQDDFENFPSEDIENIANKVLKLWRGLEEME